jgi:predicted O-methyltransferase YrrM
LWRNLFKHLRYDRAGDRMANHVRPLPDTIWPVPGWRSDVSVLRIGVRELREQSIYFRRHPVEAVEYLLAKRELAAACTDDPAQFLEALGLDPDAALEGFRAWQPILEETQTRGVTWQGWRTGLNLPTGAAIYGICRALKPRTVIETGIASGVSSAFIGAALLDNGSGELVSIELPPQEAAALYAQYGGQPYDDSVVAGWAIPEQIRSGLGSRHRIVLEDVRTALPRLLKELPGVDLFLHDDLHTVKHMSWEFELVWPRLAPGGMLVADDAGFAWTRFLRRIHGGPPINIEGTGAARRARS